MRNSDKFGQSQVAPSNFSASGYQVPTEIVELPSKGKLYSDDHPLKDVESVEIKFMTTKEEDLLISPSLNEKGVAIDRVIESLIISARVDATTLIPGDKNAILMAARKSAYGNEYQFSAFCQSCLNKNEIKANLDEIKTKEIIEDEVSRYTETGNILISLPKSKVVVEVKILNSEDERIIEETTKKRLKNNLPAEELLTRYRRMIVSVDGSSDTAAINNFVVNSLGIADSRFLRKKFMDMVPDVSFEYSHNCTNCGTLMEGGVPIGTDFFWPKL